MGKMVTDWDFTTNANPEEILKIYPDGFYDNAFGTVGIAFDEFEEPFEVTTFRTEEGYSDSRHPDKVSWGKSLDEDLSRRDFTINSMAIDVNLKLIDTYKGQVDIKEKLIRAVGDPQARFSEDALRMMRAVRIATQLGFTIEENTFEAIQKMHRSLIKLPEKESKRSFSNLLDPPTLLTECLFLKFGTHGGNLA